jgi:DNA replication and repair protein RecF
MRLEILEVQGFRNLQGTIACGDGLNILIGDNGQGKTNWLEAIFVLAAARSFRTARLVEAVSFNGELAIIRGDVRQSAEIVHSLQIAISGNTRTINVNGKKETLQRYLAELYAVVFNADELEIVRGHPEARRRFLDGGITSIYPPYLQTLTDYNKVIRQKASLLQSSAEQQLSEEKLRQLLEPWNQQLITLAARIYRARVRFVERLNQVLENRLFGGEEISIRYLSSLEGKGDLNDYEGLLSERLKLRVQAELAAGHSLIGTHRDDLEIALDGHDLRKYGSAGQQRSALLLLQIANLTVFHSQRGEYPLFLLDDVDSELDYKRIGQLLEFLRGKTQTFITTSKKDLVDKFGSGASVFHVEKGAAKMG